MKNRYSLIFTITCIVLSSYTFSVIGQCTDYTNAIFTSVTKTTVTYSDVYNLEMDIYEPDGDNSTSRPLMIIAHGGSFVSGKKDDWPMPNLGDHFAKRGYVVASIQYRLGSSASELLDSLNVLDIVMKAISDERAAIRYFTKDAATVNQYRVNPHMIVVGGYSAGSILGIPTAYINDINEVGSHIVPVINANGGLEGNSGNAGYSSTVHAVLNLAGAIDELDLIKVGDPVMVSCHGTADGTVPYFHDQVLKGTFQSSSIIKVHGSGNMNAHMDKLGMDNDLTTITGGDHPDLCNFDVLSDFLGPFTCEKMKQFPVSVNDNGSINNTINVYPNPSNNIINIVSEKKITAIQLRDLQGRVVFQMTDLLESNAELSLGNLAKGIYTLTVAFEDSIAVQHQKIVLR